VQYFWKIENMARAFSVPSVGENMYLVHCVHTTFYFYLKQLMVVALDVT